MNKKETFTTKQVAEMLGIKLSRFRSHIYYRNVQPPYRDKRRRSYVWRREDVNRAQTMLIRRGIIKHPKVLV